MNEDLHTVFKMRKLWIGRHVPNCISVHTGLPQDYQKDDLNNKLQLPFRWVPDLMCTLYAADCG